MFGQAGGAMVSETPVVTLRSSSESLKLSEDPEDIELVMQAFDFNRIKVNGVNI